MKRVFRCLAVFSAGAFCAAAIAALYDDGQFKGRPLLFADLPRNAEIVASAMERRILQNAPLGSDARILTRLLLEQGFRPGWTSPGWQRSASYTTGFLNALSRMSCEESWWVLWNVDRENRVSDIETGYVDYCM